MFMSVKGQNETAEERRAAHRRGADLNVRFRVISGDRGRKTKEVPGAVKNLSETGFCLATDLTMVDDLHILTGSSGISKNKLELKVQLPDQQEIHINGSACWYNLAEPHEAFRYNVGVQIETIPDPDLDLLRTFLRQERKEKLMKGFFNIKWLVRLFGGSIQA
jgi:hypothetical protein